MTDNYPLGAANDPRAPYNAPMECEIDVTARQELYKDLTLWTDDDHVLMHDDIMELYHEQQRTPLEIIGCCEKIVKQLIDDGHSLYARIPLSLLKDDCMGWCEESLKVGDEQYVPASETNPLDFCDEELLNFV